MSDHVLMCDCLDCMGGCPWPGAGRVVSAEEFQKLKGVLARCPQGHLLTDDNRVVRRGRRTGECKACRVQYQHEYYLSTNKHRRRKLAWSLHR